MDRLRLTFVACLVYTLPACQTPDAVLLTVTGDAKAEQYDLYVRDDTTNQMVFHSGFQPVQLAGEPMRDITKDALKIALKLSQGGKFTLLLIGVIGPLDNGKPAMGSTQMFWGGRLDVTGTLHVDARLLTVQPGDDADGDLWPDATAFVAHTPGAADLYKDKMDLLDCDDKADNPTSSTGMMLSLTAAAINPFADEICGDGFDENCNGDADEACIDGDGDGDFKGSDCDDNDPKRHHPTAADPFPDPPNCCGYSLGKAGTADEHKDFTGDPLLCPLKRCGDGIDESCSGTDTICVVDADCDGYPAAPQGNDCDDTNPAIHPGAPEICGDGIDQNCNGVPDDGCQPCDLDGDGFERSDAANGCPDSKDKHPGMVDCNDYDSGVFPGQTTAFGGKEGGAGSALAMQQLALRGDCRRVYEDIGVTGTDKIAPSVAMVGAWMIGDADCNGTPYESCPSAACDADGDGWPKDATPACNPNNVAVDCNDADPTIYPGAPDKCGNGIKENCTADVACGGNDKDGDGYLPPFDCDDTNSAVHPWAVELCNGIDDDCDGLIDEGNPDTTGKPLVTTGAITQCTDSDVGECAKQKGTCVCSAATEAAFVDPGGKRTFCPTETGGGTKPPHCFGAGQPKPQTCDATKMPAVDDDCDGRTDDPTGTNLDVKGMPCGINVGQCKAGIITGCDSSKSNCFTQFGRLPPADAWYVCSSDTVCPQAELCNGLDDDCDGVVPGTLLPPPTPGLPTNDEADHDGDKYLACTGCDPLKLKPGLIGCNDCDDTRPSSHPGAKDLCNNLDDDCNPATLDGADECPATANPNCCSSQGTCRNLGTDVNNCTMCGMVCDPLKANACGGAGCMCGGSGACGTSSYCTAGACAPCTNNTHCGPSCVNCGAGAVCKTDGSACTGCNGDGDCDTSHYCTSGACVLRLAQGGNCTMDDQCLQTGIPLFCTDGKCCNENATTCNGCRTCARGGSAGTCTSVANGNDPHNVCTANMATCLGDNCNGAGSCAVANGTVCVTQMCAAGSQTVSQCMGGSCTAQTPVLCTPYICGAGACSGSCGSDAGCVGTFYCANPTCQLKKNPGVGCGRDGECGTGHCVDSVCCNVAACGTCQACGAGGNCASVTNADDPDSCPAATKTCDSVGACKLKNAQGCGVDGTLCASTFCADGVCCNNGCAIADNCSGGSQTTYSCAAPTAGTCSMVTTVCGATYTCGASLCNSSCVGVGINANCTAGNYCNGTACVACTVALACGAACKNCAGDPTGLACVNNGGTLGCGCTLLADCDPTRADSCDAVSKTCKCGNGVACTGAQTCQPMGMTMKCLP